MNRSDVIRISDDAGGILFPTRLGKIVSDEAAIRFSNGPEGLFFCVLYLNQKIVL